MQMILRDRSPAALTRAIRANWADYFISLSRAPGVELAAGPSLTWVLTGIPDAFLNVVLRTQLPPDRAGAIIDEALAHFSAVGAHQLSWWADDETPAAELGPHLTRRGLTFSEGSVAMAADLLALPEGPAGPAGLTIMPVEDHATLRAWCALTCANFGIPEHGERRCFALFADLGFDLPIRSYLALLNGMPVGTSQLFLGAGVAGIYHVTCLPEARGQGIGAALTLAPLRDARSMGYRTSILQASPMGYPVYRRLGFQVYGRLNSYLWERADDPPMRGSTPHTL